MRIGAQRGMLSLQCVFYLRVTVGRRVLGASKSGHGTLEYGTGITGMMNERLLESVIAGILVRKKFYFWSKLLRILLLRELA